MNIYFKTLFKNFHVIVGAALVACLLTLAISFVRPLEYTSAMTLLIVQKNSGTLDPYTVFKSVELIGDNLSQIIYTSAFFDRVMQTDPSINQNIFSKNEATKRAEWSKMVAASVTRGTGFLKLTIYHPDVTEARKIGTAISNVLIQDGWRYVNADIEIRLVDAPLQSRWPMRPNLLVNAVLGLLAGALGGSLYVLWRHRLLKKAFSLIDDIG